MTPKDARIDHTDAPEDPIENQQEDWEEEDWEEEIVSWVLVLSYAEITEPLFLLFFLFVA